MQTNPSVGLWWNFLSQAPLGICRNPRLDTVALVPASLLPRKGKYQRIANNLPGRGVLICQADKKEQISRILERVAVFFRHKGHFVKMLPYSLI